MDDNDLLNCAEERYPYPDGCVKLVMGLELDGRADIPRKAAMVIVSTKDDVAEASFNARCPGFCAHAVSSLDDVRWQVQQLRELDATRRNWLMRKLHKPYMVTFRWTMGRFHRRFVLSSSAASAYLHVVPQPYAGMAVALSDLEALLARMDRAKTGEEKVEYAWDYRKGGDWRHHAAARIANWTPEEKAWSDEQIRNHRRVFTNDDEHGMEKQEAGDDGHGGDLHQSLARWSREQPPEYHAWKKRKLEELAPYMAIPTIQPEEPTEPAATKSPASDDVSA